MMTHEERTEVLREFGYTEREATFLCLAALHSGYFIRRQYCQFLAVMKGRPDDLLVRKVLARKHGKQYSTSQRTFLYHLCSRPFYAAIGEPDNRHRRMRPPFAIKAKLMALDYVLANPNHRYLATEEEKLSYFNGERGIPIDALPTKIYRSPTTLSKTERHFVDKFPIFIPVDQDSSPPVVSFCYIDEGVIATPGFETYLKQYAGLFAALGQFRIIYVSTQARHARASARVFNRLFDRVGLGKTPRCGSFKEQLLTYFQLEHLFRTSQFDQLNAVRLEELRALRRAFKAPRFEELFELWKQHGEEAVEHFLSVDNPKRYEHQPKLMICPMNHSYNFL